MSPPHLQKHFRHVVVVLRPPRRRADTRTPGPRASLRLHERAVIPAHPGQPFRHLGDLAPPPARVLGQHEPDGLPHGAGFGKRPALPKPQPLAPCVLPPLLHGIRRPAGQEPLPLRVPFQERPARKGARRGERPLRPLGRRMPSPESCRMPSRVRGLMRERMRSRARRPRAPQRKPSAGQGHPRRNASPCGHSPDGYSPASARPQGPHPAGFRPAKRFRRKRRPRPELRARQTGKPPAPPQPPIPDRVARARAPFPPSAAVPAPVPDWAYPPERLPRRVWARLRREPRQDFRDGWRKRRARPGPTRRGTPRRTHCGTPPQASGRPHPCAPAWPLQRGFRQVPEGPHPRTHNIGRFRHVVAEEVQGTIRAGPWRPPWRCRARGLPRTPSGTPFRTTRAHRRGRGRSPGSRRAGSCAGASAGTAARACPLSESSRTLASFQMHGDILRYFITFPPVWRPGRPCRPPKPQVFLQLFRSLAPRDETPAKRQRRADDAGLAPDWAGQGCRAPGHSLGPVHESAPYPMYGMDNSIYENKWQQKKCHMGIFPYMKKLATVPG